MFCLLLAFLGPAASAAGSYSSVQAHEDYFLNHGRRLTDLDIPGIERIKGIDDIIYNEKTQTVVVARKDRFITLVDLKAKTVTDLAKTPLSPAGMKFSPVDPDTLYFCALRFFGDGIVYDAIQYDDSDLPGIYQLNLKSGQVRPVLNFLPPLGSGSGAGSRFALGSLDAVKRRPFKVCNDLDISADGKRIYAVESYQADTENGPPAVMESIHRWIHGNIWKIDLSAGELTLLANGYTYPDGITLEKKGDGPETGVVFSELPMRRLVRLELNSEFRSVGAKTLISNLPGFPDGLDRDPSGRIHVALFKDFNFMAKLTQKIPGLAAFVLRHLPYAKWPVPKKTGLLILDADGSNPLFYTMHSGSFVREVSAVSAGNKQIFLSVFEDRVSGLYFIPHPLSGPGTDKPLN